MRGEKPDRSKIHQLAGRTHHAKREEATPGKPVMDIRPPKRLKGIARATWKRLAQQLVDDQNLTELSRDHFAAYCDAVYDYERARIELEKKQTLVLPARSGGTPQQIAEIGISNRALERMLKLGEMFALDPYVRERRGKAKPAKPDDDAADGAVFTPAVGE